MKRGRSSSSRSRGASVLERTGRTVEWTCWTWTWTRTTPRAGGWMSPEAPSPTTKARPRRWSSSESTSESAPGRSSSPEVRLQVYVVVVVSGRWRAPEARSSRSRRTEGPAPPSPPPPPGRVELSEVHKVVSGRRPPSIGRRRPSSLRPTAVFVKSPIVVSLHLCPDGSLSLPVLLVPVDAEAVVIEPRADLVIVPHRVAVVVVVVLLLLLRARLARRWWPSRPRSSEGRTAGSRGRRTPRARRPCLTLTSQLGKGFLVGVSVIVVIVYVVAPLLVLDRLAVVLSGSYVEIPVLDAVVAAAPPEVDCPAAVGPASCCLPSSSSSSSSPGNSPAPPEPGPRRPPRQPVQCGAAVVEVPVGVCRVSLSVDACHRCRRHLSSPPPPLRDRVPRGLVAAAAAAPFLLLLLLVAVVVVVV